MTRTIILSATALVLSLLSSGTAQARRKHDNKALYGWVTATDVAQCKVTARYVARRSRVTFYGAYTRCIQNKKAANATAYRRSLRHRRVVRVVRRHKKVYRTPKRGHKKVYRTPKRRSKKVYRTPKRRVKHTKKARTRSSRRRRR